MKPLMLFFLLSFAVNVGYANFDSLFVIVNKDTATIWDKNAQSNCASKFEFEAIQKQDTLVIIERDTVGPLFRCTCLFDLSVTTRNFAGSYVVMVYRQNLKVHHYMNDTTIFIGTTYFSIPNPNMLPYFFVKGYQSPCTGSPVRVEQRDHPSPQNFLLTNYPNPLNASTTISFTVPPNMTDAQVELTIFSEQGEQVRQLTKAKFQAGTYNVRWKGDTDDGSPAASGAYFYCLTVNNVQQIGKMNLVK